MLHVHVRMHMHMHMCMYMYVVALHLRSCVEQAQVIGVDIAVDPAEGEQALLEGDTCAVRELLGGVAAHAWRQPLEGLRRVGVDHQRGEGRACDGLAVEVDRDLVARSEQ